MVDFGTKYWIVVSVLALVLLTGTGALTVWICKIYDTQKTATLPPGVSPFPDVVPIVTPPATDPTVNNCYSWCDGKECPNGTPDNPCPANGQTCVKPTTCSTDLDCQTACSVPNNVTNPPVCNKDNVCGPPYQACVSGFTTTNTVIDGVSTPTADPSNLKKCLTSEDCNVCTDTPVGEQMNCVFVKDFTSVNINDITFQDIPQGYYCMPQRTGCNAKAGTSTWTDQGWQCQCRWPDIMGGPECNILLACGNNKVRDDAKGLQQLLVNCNDPSNPLCGQPWVPESDIDPVGCYSKSKGFGTAADCKLSNGDPNPDAMPNTVCQCDGLDGVSNKGYTYDPKDPRACVLDPCNNGAWGRSLQGDAGYMLNNFPSVSHTLSIVAPVANKYLSLKSQSLLTLSDSPTDTKFVFNNANQPGMISASSDFFKTFIYLGSSADKTQVGDYGKLNYPDGSTWVLQSVQGTPVDRRDNLDTLVMYNPLHVPDGAQFTDPIYNDQKRYLLYNNSTSTFYLGDRYDPNIVYLNRLYPFNLNVPNASSTDQSKSVAQPFTNCACSGANSVSAVKGCFDSNDNFVGIYSLLDQSDLAKCDDTYSRYVSALCDPYTIPNSVVTLQPGDDSKYLCSLYRGDLNNLGIDEAVYSSTNLLPFRSGFVPGLGKFIDPITGVEVLKSVCTADPCTGRSGDAAYSVQSNSGYWNALGSVCACTNGNTDDPSQNYYPFPVEYLNQQWNNECKTDPTSSACICDHITNPVCAVCQNACQGNTFCKSSPDYPCEKGVNCDTDVTTGGPKCVCTGNCIQQPGTGNLCMGRIPTNGLCKGLESQPNVCLSDGDTCKNFAMTYNWYWGAGDDPRCGDTGETVSYCTSDSNDYCWDSQSDCNQNVSYAELKCIQGDGYNECPISTPSQRGGNKTCTPASSETLTK